MPISDIAAYAELKNGKVVYTACAQLQLHVDYNLFLCNAAETFNDVIYLSPGPLFLSSKTGK